MKKIKICLLATALLIFFQVSSFSQLNKIGTMMASGPEDAGKLIGGYMSPYLNALGASMSGGWYNTAKPHKLGGFDLTFTINTSIIQESFRTFDVAELGMQSLVLADANDNISQTIAGKKELGPMLNYNAGSYSQPAFELPRGTNNPVILSPMIQLGLGLVKGTEIMGRYVPEMRVGPAKVGMWGIGLKHSLLQHLPLAEKLPVLNVSLMGGYTKLTSSLGFMVTPDDIGLGILPVSGYTGAWDNQELAFNIKSFTMNLLVSADLPVVTFYGGAGFVNTKADLQLNGDYPVLDASSGTPQVVAATDPVDMAIKNKDGGISKPRLNVGMRFKMAVITIHFDYTRANYNVVTGGLGISFR